MTAAWVRVSPHVVRVAMTSGRSATGDRVRRVAMGRTDTVFRLYALAREPAVSPGASRRELERALKDNVLAVAELVGTYQR